MGGIETTITVFLLFGITSFCLISGYMLGHLQRVLPAIEELIKVQRESRDMLKRCIDEKPANDFSALPPGVYEPGEPNPITGLTKLVPLRDDMRS